MTILKRFVLLVVLVMVAVSAWLGLKHMEGQSDVVLNGDERRLESMKRLNAGQYRRIIHDVFGRTIKIRERFVSVAQRVDGLLEVGASQLGMSTVSLEMAEDIARDVAHQVTDKTHRLELVPCTPESETAFDQACAKQFIASIGRLLFRRPLTDTERQRQLAVAKHAAREQSDFYAGLERSLANMLVSPNFLFRVEYSMLDQHGDFQLEAYSRATRLSFLLWDSTPDNALLLAAERGDLYKQKGLLKQVERMLGVRKLEGGVRAFFSDMLAFDGFNRLIKDASLFPNYTWQAISDTREQTLRTLVDHLLTRDGDYRDLFTTRRTFLTPVLAAQLGIPLYQDKPNALPDRWQSYEFDEGDPRAGLLAQPGFVVLHSHPGRTSPTLRGKALRELLLCQEVPPPPPNVDFNLVQDSDNPDYKTMRDRLSAHATNPTCAGCHKITDPIGLALENFDGGGLFRTTENGKMIDSSGSLDGATYADAAGLGLAMRNNPSAVSCLVNRVYAYGVGREMAPDDRKWLKQLRKEFAKGGYKLPHLLRLIGTSTEFYKGSNIEPSLAAN